MSRSSKIFLLGARGLLGTHVAAALREADLPFLSDCELPRFETADEAKAFIAAQIPTTTVNCMGYIGEDPAAHRIINAEIPRAIAEETHSAKSLFIHMSTNAVFAADEERRWLPADMPEPQTDYEKSKALGEDPRALVIRASFIGKNARGKGFFDQALQGKTFSDRRWNGVTAWALSSYIVQLILRHDGTRRSGVEHVHSGQVTTFLQIAKHLDSASAVNGLWKATKLLGGGVQLPSIEEQLSDYLHWLSHRSQETPINRRN